MSNVIQYFSNMGHNMTALDASAEDMKMMNQTNRFRAHLILSVCYSPDLPL